MATGDKNKGRFEQNSEPRRELAGESAKEKRRKLEFAQTVEAPAVSLPESKPAVDPFAKTLTAIPAKQPKKPGG